MRPWEFHDPLARPSGRRLMDSCTGSDTLLGSVNVAGSIVILLLIGFVVGFALAWFIQWRKQRKRMLLELEFRDRFPDAVKKENPDISPMIRSAEVPPAPLPSAPYGAEPKLPQTAATLASGPLARGVRDSGVLPAVVVTGQVPQRTTSSSSGNPFSDPVPPSPVPAAVPLQTLPSSRESSPQQQGPLARSFARSMSSAQSPASVSAPSPARDTGLVAETVHARTGTVVVNPLAGSPGSGAPGSQHTADYAAAVAASADSGNPFMAAKQAHKQELLAAVSSEEYEEEELDPEWQTLLAQLDARLRGAGKQPMNSKERAVAIRSLIVATASQSPDAALDKALQDVNMYRKTQQFAAGA